MLFKLILIYRNLDEVVDMGDGECFIRFVKYEFFIYYKMGKMKYIIGFIYFIVFVLGLFLF